MTQEIPPGVVIESVFLVEARYTREATTRRPPVRAEHLARIADLTRAGTVVAAGAYTDAMTSSLLIVRAPDAGAALALARTDVYMKAAVWDEITIRPFGLVSAEPSTPPGEGTP
jgi:uncharacterized protein YciI